jgi:hypothetical protein
MEKYTLAEGEKIVPLVYLTDKKVPMVVETSFDIITDELMEGAYIHDAHTGFREDYLTLHCLLCIHQPKTIFEIGTNIGEGINVMATALPEAKIFSLDLDYETMCLNSKQYPLDINGNDRVGTACRFHYTQLRGDSTVFDYSKYKCEAYFIDGEHIEKNVTIETWEVLRQKPKIVIYHDADMPEVMAGIVAGLSKTKGYQLYRVIGTRIAYLLRK